MRMMKTGNTPAKPSEYAELNQTRAMQTPFSHTLAMLKQEPHEKKGRKWQR
jgi:hypothetical protein